MKIRFNGTTLKTARDCSNRLIWAVGTVWVLTLLVLVLPEWVAINNHLITAITQVQYPPENAQKSELTNGITRDFVSLRSSLSSETINPRSPFIFVIAHTLFAVLTIVVIVCTIRRMKNTFRSPV